MLVTFKSKFSADIIMFDIHLAKIFKLLNKNMKRGILTVKEIDSAIQLIENLIENEHQNVIESKINVDEFDNESNKTKKQKNINSISLAVRLFPLLEMLRKANIKKTDVLWGI